ncbi:MAG: glycosyltransferase family 39 protein [Candidatus Eisenbacteria bacterium]
MSTPARIGAPAERLLFPAVLALASMLRLFELGRRNLWTDEGSTWTAASLPLPQMLERCIVRDASPPLYYLVTAFFLRVGGGSEAALRFSSVLASLALVWLTYRLARLALPRPGASLAALFCALAPYQVMFAQEARTYTLVAAFSVWGTYLFALGILQARARVWPGYASAVALSLWTQSIALLALPTHALVAVMTRAGRRQFKPWALALLVAAAIFAPWAYLSRDLAQHMAHSHFYIEEPTLMGLVKVLRGLLLSPMPIVSAPAGSVMPGLDFMFPRPVAWALLILPPITLLVATLRGAFDHDSRGGLTRIMWLAWITPVVAVLTVSFLGRPLLLPRYFVFATPYIAVLFALGAMSLMEAIRSFAVGLLVLVQLLGLARYHHDATKEPWREVAAHMEATSPPGRTAAFVVFDADPLRFYEHRYAPGVKSFEVSHPTEPFGAEYTESQLAYLDSMTHQEAAGYEDVWVLVRSLKSPVRHRVVTLARRAAGEARVLVEDRRWESFGGPVMSWHYAKGGMAAVPDSAPGR